MERTTNVARAVRRLPGGTGDPKRRLRRREGMALPELLALIVAVIAWIVLLGGLAPDS